MYEHHKRLVYGKLVDKTLADYDYSKLAEFVYGRPYAPDVARRLLYGSRKTIDIIEAERICPVDDAIAKAELDAKILEVKKERQKLSDQRREYKKTIRDDARREYMYERLAEAAEELTYTIGSMYENVSPSTEFSENEAVLVLSDWHYGMITSNVFNTYDTQICADRVRHTTEQAASRLKLHGCSKLYVVVLGDVCHGAIHNSARVASEELVCDQIMQVSEILAQSIEYLSQFVKETVVYSTYGNHARTVQNKTDSIHRDNMERLVPWWLAQRLSSYENIEVRDDEGTEFVFIDVCGHGFCATHGDNDSVRSVTRLLPTLFHKKLNRDVEYVLIGDKHHRESFEELGCTAMICGSLCGADDYANDKRLYSEPSQLLLIVNPECGVDAEYRIRCT